MDTIFHASSKTGQKSAQGSALPNSWGSWAYPHSTGHKGIQKQTLSGHFDVFNHGFRVPLRTRIDRKLACGWVNGCWLVQGKHLLAMRG